MQAGESMFNRKEQLQDIARKLKTAAATGRSAPLAASKDVVKLGEQWDDYKSEVGGISCTAWLKKVSGQNYAWWAVRSEAVDKLGEASRRVLDHNVAVYVSRNIDQAHVDQVYFMLRQEFKQNGDIPLSLAGARPKIDKLLKRRSARKECESCKELRKLLAQHGITESPSYNEDIVSH